MTHVSETTAPQEAGTVQLLEQLSEQVQRLVRAELAVARKEATSQAKVFAVAGGTFGAGAMLMLAGGACAIAAAVIGLSNVLRPWFAALVVGAACVLLALLIVAPGWKGIRDRRPPVPHDTVENLKRDVAAVTESVHR